MNEEFNEFNINNDENVKEPGETVKTHIKRQIIVLVFVMIMFAIAISGLISIKTISQEMLERTTTTTTTTTTKKAYPKELDESKEYALEINNKTINLTYNFYYQEIDDFYIEIPATDDSVPDVQAVHGYNYVLEIIDNNSNNYGSYIIGLGETKEEAKQTSQKYNFDLSIISQIKDKGTNDYKLLLLIPECGQSSWLTYRFIITPTIYTDKGELLKRIYTSINYAGFTFIEEEQYGFSFESVDENLGVYIIKDDTIYFTEDNGCGRGEGEINDLQMAEVINNKVVINIIARSEIINGAGQCG